MGSVYLFQLLLLLAEVQLLALLHAALDPVAESALAVLIVD